MEGEALQAWRSATRKRLVASRMALERGERERLDAAIEGHVEALLARLAPGVVGFCWPYKGEYDARGPVERLMARGARAALPVVVAPKAPLRFREWRPGEPLDQDLHGIPVPRPSAAELVPDVVLLPMNGFDGGGYRLGYGGGYFDRTLAALARRPLVVGIAYELGRLDTIYPQPHDIPLDVVVTEAGARRRAAARLG